MKKKLTVILLGALMCLSLTACSLFTSGDSADSGSEGGQTAETDEDFSLAMTDSYTFTDPENLEFDTRYVLVGDENCKLLTDMKNFGYSAVKVYEIIYEKDGAAAGEYDYFVTQDEAAAQALAEYYTSMGQQVTQEGSILYSFVEGDTLQANIAAFVTAGSISDDSVEAYVEMMKDFNGLMDY